MAAERKTNFTFDERLTGWNKTSQAWLIDNERDKVWSSIATSNIVFNPEGRILLVQRAAHDTKPGMWECPGGAADDDDPSILYAAARELWEETGLTAKRYTNIVGPGPGRPFEQLIPSTRNKPKIWCRFTFVAEVVDSTAVKLDPNEHQDYMWATKEEVQAERSGDRAIPITSSDVRARLLEALRLLEEAERDGKGAESSL